MLRLIFSSQWVCATVHTPFLADPWTFFIQTIISSLWSRNSLNHEGVTAKKTFHFSIKSIRQLIESWWTSCDILTLIYQNFLICRGKLYLQISHFLFYLRDYWWKMWKTSFNIQLTRIRWGFRKFESAIKSIDPNYVNGQKTINLKKFYWKSSSSNRQLMEFEKKNWV